MTRKKKRDVILMYHGIISKDTNLPCERETGAEIYDVKASDFHAQMEILKKEGYSVVGPRDKRAAPGNKDIILTFDDGEMNNYQEAAPILREFDFAAYFFIIVKRVGRDGYMGWGEIKKLYESGMNIGSHGLSHVILTNLKDSQIEEELTASKKTIERNLGIRIDSLSVPRGFCNDKIIRMANEAGYRQVFISDEYSNLKLDYFSRIAVRRKWPLKKFRQIISGYEPWGESFYRGIKMSAKILLRESGYNWFRNLLIKSMK